MTGAPTRFCAILFTPFTADASCYVIRRLSAGSSSHTRHSSTSETIKHYISRLGIVKNISHDGWVWYLRVISVGCINGVVLPFAYITCIRFLDLKISFTFPFSFKLFLLLLPFCNKVIEPRIGTSRVIWRVGEPNNVFVLTDGEPFYLAKLGQFFSQFFTEILTAFLVVCECHAKNGNRSLVLSSLFIQSTFILGVESI